MHRVHQDLPGDGTRHEQTRVRALPVSLSILLSMPPRHERMEETRGRGKRERERYRLDIVPSSRFSFRCYVAAKEPPTKDRDDPRTWTRLAATSADDPFVSTIRDRYYHFCPRSAVKGSRVDNFSAVRLTSSASSPISNRKCTGRIPVERSKGSRG